MRIVVFDNITNKEKSAALKTMIEHSTPRQDFFLLVILSVSMATIGLLQNNAAVIIGSMLIAPVLYPLLGIAMGTVMADKMLISRSLGTLAKSILIGVLASVIVTLLTYVPGDGFEATTEIILRTSPSLLNAATAIIAGLAASFALVKPQLNETLPGVAISVALVPPLAVFGIGLATLNWKIAINSMVLFLINVLGIVFACVMVFSIMNFYAKRQVADETIKKEDKKLEKENEEVIEN
jgi:uncharacterized hydrophobic protein (TIGR00271 family)